MRRAYVLCAIAIGGVCLLATLAAQAAPYTARVTVAAGDSDRGNTPVCVDVKTPAALGDVDPASLRARLTPFGRSAPVIVGQVERPEGVGADTVRVWWLLPACKAGEEASFTLVVAPADRMPARGFVWRDEPGDHLELVFDGRAALR